MKKAEEFRNLIDNLLNKIMEAKSHKREIYISAEDAVFIFTNLNQQIGEQKEEIIRLSDEIERTKKELTLLIKELVKSGYIKISERRNLLKRNLVNQEALMSLLLKKKIITRKEISDIVRDRHNAIQSS